MVDTCTRSHTNISHTHTAHTHSQHKTSHSSPCKYFLVLNFFRRFFDHYSDIPWPLEESTSRYTRFSWSTAQQKAFDRLKESLLTAPVLQLVDSTKKLPLVMDASDCSVAGVLLQEDGSGDWHRIAYTSRRLNLNFVEQNYHATERETLAVIHSLQTGRFYFHKAFEIVTDNRAVTNLRRKKDLTRREARWIDLVADFDFSITHRPGRENLVDSLSRRPFGLIMKQMGGHKLLLVGWQSVRQTIITNAIYRQQCNDTTYNLLLSFWCKNFASTIFAGGSL